LRCAKLADGSSRQYAVSCIEPGQRADADIQQPGRLCMKKVPDPYFSLFLYFYFPRLHYSARYARPSEGKEK
jgi:hypothetical protein